MSSLLWQGWLKPQPHWVEDADAATCTLCSSKFTFVRRRHHCRRCGVVICQECSKTKLPLFRYGMQKKERICEACSEDVKLENLCVTEHVPLLKTGLQFELCVLPLSELSAPKGDEDVKRPGDETVNTPSNDSPSGPAVWVHGDLEANSLKLYWRDVNAIAGDDDDDDGDDKQGGIDGDDQETGRATTTKPPFMAKIDEKLDVTDLVSIQSLGQAFTGFSLIYRRINAKPTSIFLASSPAETPSPPTVLQSTTVTFLSSQTSECHRWMKALADIIRMISKDKEQVRRFDPRLTLQGGKLIPRMLNGEEKDGFRFSLLPSSSAETQSGSGRQAAHSSLQPNNKTRGAAEIRSKSPAAVSPRSLQSSGQQSTGRLKSSRSMQNLLAPPPAAKQLLTVSASGSHQKVQKKSKTPTHSSKPDVPRSATVAIDGSHPIEGHPHETVELEDGDTDPVGEEDEEGKALLVPSTTVGETTDINSSKTASTTTTHTSTVVATVGVVAVPVDPLEEFGETNDEPHA